MIKVHIKNITAIHGIKITEKNLKSFKSFALTILKKEKAPRNTETSITLVDNPYIRKLNAKYRRKNHPTDVIAFAFPVCEKDSFMGDIYISVEQANQQIQKGETLQIELKRLLIHGILHILSYDHSKKMKEREKYYLKL